MTFKTEWHIFISPKIHVNFIFDQAILDLQIEGGMTNFQGLYKTTDTLNRAKLKM